MLKPLFTKLQDKRVILASSSKQRADLLNSVGLNFQIYPSEFEENLDPLKHSSEEFVGKTALGKVNDVFQKIKKDPFKKDIIIGADTVVTHNNVIFGKPASENEAFRLLQVLTQSGIPHVVYTGVVIKYEDQVKCFTETTKVFMAKLDDDEIRAYIETGEPMGKAGAYGIQGIAKSFIERIEGDTNNVIGLPLCRLTQTLKNMLE